MIISIQLLRFIAASLVVLTHSMSAGGANGIGGFGVDIFFVISGFIMSHVTASRTSSREFLMRRGVRIIPMYWLFTMGIAVVSLALPSLLGETVFSPAKFLYSLFFIPHWNEAMGWSPLLKLGWTLNLEMFFYVIFAIAMQISHKYREVLASLLLLGLAMLLDALPIAEHSPLQYWTKPVTYEFIFGMSLALFYSRTPALFDSIPLLGSALLSFLAIGFMSFIDIGGQQFNGMRYLLWGAPATVVVASALASEKYVSISDRGRRFVLWLGDMSYPVYLIHIYVVLALSRVFGLDLWPFIFCISMVLAHLASHAVSEIYDKPMRSVLTNHLFRV